MKKLRFFSMVCLLALVIGSLAGCQQEENGTNNGNNSGNDGSTQTGYVDLDLPSGTKWKASNETGNESGYYTFDEAVTAFGDKLPSKEQLEELRVHCTWEWQYNVGYKVTGQNGNYITLPAAGRLHSDGNVSDVGYFGNYWSSTPYDSQFAWYINFSSSSVGWDADERYFKQSVRLVQN